MNGNLNDLNDKQFEDIVALAAFAERENLFHVVYCKGIIQDLIESGKSKQEAFDLVFPDIPKPHLS